MRLDIGEVAEAAESAAAYLALEMQPMDVDLPVPSVGSLRC